jgi:hypothetical protein
LEDAFILPAGAENACPTGVQKHRFCFRTLDIVEHAERDEQELAVLRPWIVEAQCLIGSLYFDKQTSIAGAKSQHRVRDLAMEGLLDDRTDLLSK